MSNEERTTQKVFAGLYLYFSSIEKNIKEKGFKRRGMTLYTTINNSRKEEEEEEHLLNATHRVAVCCILYEHIIQIIYKNDDAFDCIVII